MVYIPLFDINVFFAQIYMERLLFCCLSLSSLSSLALEMCLLIYPFRVHRQRVVIDHLAAKRTF
jgi:hypothetical protein